MTTMEERRQQARRQFLWRVAGVVMMIGLVAYAGWFAPWAKPRPSIPVVLTH